MRKKGKLYVFEGADGVGKTTIAQCVSNHLHKLNISSVYLSFPGRYDNTLGKLIYELHHNPRQFNIESLNATSLQTLHIAAHIEVIEEKILPAIEQGDIVILDRFWWSTVVYGQLNNVNTDVLARLIKVEQCCWGKTRPKKVFHFKRSTSLKKDLNNEDWNVVSALYDKLAITKKKCGFDC
jgi:dTMP kinase